MTSTIKVDTISEKTSGNGVVIDSVTLKDSTVDVNGTSDGIILDADADTTISADTDDQIDFKAGGTDIMSLTATTATINDGVTITVDDNSDNLTLVSTDADAGNGPNLRLYRNSGSPANSDLLGNIEFEGKNNNSEDVVYGAIEAQISDLSDGAEHGSVFFKSIISGTLQERFRLNDTSVVFNEGSIDSDFRVESDDVTHMLFVDAGNDAVCIGNSDLNPSTSSTATHAVFKNGGSKLEISASNNTSLAVNRVNSEGTAVELRQAGGLRGSISVAGATAAFNTSSDYRLKENVSYDWDATTRLKQLKPARFNWISDDTNTLVDGFLAHEAKTVVPESVIGEKDAVDENGDVDPQQIDHSKLVPLLVKTVQELEARLKILEDA